MTDKHPNKTEKQAELLKFRDLVLATLDYYLDNKELQIKSADFESVEYYNGLKKQAEEDYHKGRLTKLKQWFHSLTEMQIETLDFKFSKYLKEKTKYDTDIFKSYFQRVDKVIEKGIITSDDQFYDINIMVDQICRSEPIDNERIEKLNSLLREYEKRKTQKIKRPTP